MYDYQYIRDTFPAVEVAIKDFTKNGWRVHTFTHVANGQWFVLFEKQKVAKAAPTRLTK